MKLWTWQTPNFSLTDGRVDPAKSEYTGEPGVLAAYRELGRRLGTDQIVWCVAKDDPDAPRDDRKICWTLDVPASEVLAVVDDLVWNRILGKECALPRAMRARLREKAVQVNPHDPHGALERLESEFWNQPEPQGGWSSVLFVKEHDQEGVSVLIRHPVRPEWVTHHQPEYPLLKRRGL